MMKHNRLTKVTLVILPVTSHLAQLCISGPVWAKIMQPYVPGIYATMIHSIKVLKCSMTEYHSLTKVILVNLPKNSLSGQGRLRLNLGQNYTTCPMIHSQRIISKFCRMMGYNTWTKVVLVIFPKKAPFGAIWSQFGPKLHNFILR